MFVHMGDYMRNVCVDIPTNCIYVAGNTTTRLFLLMKNKHGTELRYVLIKSWHSAW